MNTPIPMRLGRLKSQLSNSIVDSRFGHVSICSDAAAAESTGFRRHVDGATLQLHGQQGTGTWLPRYSHCLTSACCSGYEYGEHGEHSGQVCWTAGVIAPPVNVYY